jgi:dTDP-glucose 4,6-dehydratase
MPKTILITGSNGFIGSNMVDYILEKTDWDIIAIDKNSPKLFNERIMNCYIDLTDPAGWPRESFDYVIHFAALKDVKTSFVDINPYVKANVLGTANLMKWLKSINFKGKIINFSTAAVLGSRTDTYTPDEYSPFNPKNPYAATKAAQELMANIFRIFDLNTVNVRIDTPFGPKQPIENFVPFVINNVTSKIIELCGEAPYNQDGIFYYSQRSWIYVKDICERLMHVLLTTSNNNIWHIPGNSYSILKLAKMIADIMNVELQYKNIQVLDRKYYQDVQNRYGLKCLTSPWALIDGNLLSEDDFKQRLKDTIRWYKPTLIKNTSKNEVSK